MLDEIEQFQKQAPDGCLKCQIKSGKTYYYHQLMNEETGKWDRKYIKRSNFQLAKNLAQKNYYSIVKTVISAELVVLTGFIKHYHPIDLNKIYDELSIERQKIVQPFRDEIDDKIRAWKEEMYEVNRMYPENLKYETDQGELVRSKSELIIANLLYQYREDILYKYEKPLKVIVDGRMFTIYPDFTVINICTGKIKYWEHAGLLDVAEYANDFVKKINTYASNGFLLGRDVIITCETSENSLDIGVIKKIVEELRGN